MILVVHRPRFLRASWSQRASNASVNIAPVRDLPTDNNANCLLNISALLFISFHLHLNCSRKILGPFNKQGKWALERCGKLAKDTEIINATTRSNPRLSTPKPMHLQMSQAKVMTSACHRVTSTSHIYIILSPIWSRIWEAEARRSLCIWRQLILNNAPGQPKLLGETLSENQIKTQVLFTLLIRNLVWCFNRFRGDSFLNYQLSIINCS